MALFGEPTCRHGALLLGKTFSRPTVLAASIFPQRPLRGLVLKCWLAEDWVSKKGGACSGGGYLRVVPILPKLLAAL